MKTKAHRVLLVASILLVVIAPLSTGQVQTMDNKAVIEMAEKGISHALIIEAISSAPKTDFRFAVDDYAAFTKAKISPEILRAMTARQEKGTSASSSMRVSPVATQPSKLPEPLRDASASTVGTTSGLARNGAPTSTAVILPNGTPVRMRLAQTISSGTAKLNETIPFEVLEDIKVGEITVVPKGTTAVGSVTQVQPKRRMGRSGKLDVALEYVLAVSGEKILLTAQKGGSGGSNVGKVTTGVVVTSLVFFPAAPLFLLAHGKDLEVLKGTEITGYTNGDTKLLKFSNQ